MRQALLALMILITTSVTSAARAAVLHEERSLYRNIVISEANGQRCMRFVLHDKINHNQSCLFLHDSNKMVFDYTKMILASLFILPEPKTILVVGLGGGTLPMVFHQLLPNTHITSVEIDPAVVKAAKQYFNYRETPQVTTELLDARVFIKRALRQGKKWDLIILDAFNGDYIPEHLMTREFLLEVQGVLNSGGLVAANTFTASRLYHHESATYNSVFSHLRMLSRGSGNRVLFAANEAVNFPAPELASKQWQARLTLYGLNVHEILALEEAHTWDKSAKILTDQYAPANILKNR